ncbi:MAG: hypothetical protein J7L34_03035 [Thermotogaceae bacterium]|nr:hypothetical protein [Thermotogaceae bacterium]
MSKKNLFLLWTLIALVALVFYYSKGLYKVYYISIAGDEAFKKNVERALGLSHLRYRIVDRANIVFNGDEKTFIINDHTYHLDWQENAKEKALDGSGCSGDCKFVPVVNGKLDEENTAVLMGCVDIIKGKGSRIFDNGWLAVKMAVIRDGKPVLVYDPLTKEKIFQNY